MLSVYLTLALKLLGSMIYMFMQQWAGGRNSALCLLEQTYAPPPYGRSFRAVDALATEPVTGSDTETARSVCYQPGQARCVLLQLEAVWQASGSKWSISARNNVRTEALELLIDLTSTWLSSGIQRRIVCWKSTDVSVLHIEACVQQAATCLFLAWRWNVSPKRRLTVRYISGHRTSTALWSSHIMGGQTIAREPHATLLNI
jgi:hypothetical protein